MAKPTDMLTGLNAVRLRQLVDYDPLTGIFTRLVRAGQTGLVGDVLGNRKRPGYLTGSIEGRVYLLHRLAWLYMTGEWPEDMIDHEDTNKQNNVWKNLRPATNAENQRNMGLKPSNKSGKKGVVWDKNHKAWRAQISDKGRTRMIGRFKDIDIAYAAFCREARVIHGEFARLE